MDLQPVGLSLKRANIVSSRDCCVIANSKLVIGTAGACQQEGESQFNLVHRNVNIFKLIIPNFVKNSPHYKLLIVSNPMDILTYMAWKINGFSQKQSCKWLQSGFSSVLLPDGRKAGSSSTELSKWVMGDHGDSSVPM